MSERQHCLWSRTAGTEALRIMVSISRGCVGDGDAGISPSSSQSNGIYVQRRILQQGNKCLRPPVTRRHSLASYSLHHLSIFPVCAFIFHFSTSSSFFFRRAFLQSVTKTEKDPSRTPTHMGLCSSEKNSTKKKNEGKNLKKKITNYV